MRILIIGAGAVGGYFGARLAKAGRDVTFLVREKRAAQIHATGGLVVTDPDESFTVQPRLLLATELKAKPETFDLIVVATKAYGLEQAMNDFAPAVGKGTSVLPLLNGMRHLEALKARLGERVVLGGSTRIAADLDADGRVTSTDRTLHDVHFGEVNGEVTERAKAVEGALSDAGFEVKLEPDIVAFMWTKWTMLSALAGITCLLRASIGEVAAVTGGVETERAILAESAAIAAANGYALKPEMLAGVEARMTEKGSTLTASIYRDMMRGGAVEVEPILGDLLQRGRAKGVRAPLLTAAYVTLAVYEKRLESK